MPPVVQIAGCHTLNAGQSDGRPEKPRSLHADPNDAEANPIAGSDRVLVGPYRFRIENHGAGSQQGAGGPDAGLQEFTAGQTSFFHLVLDLNGNSEPYFFSIFTATSLKKTTS